VIRAAYAAIWNGKYPRIIIKAPRGGGKSKLLGTVGFDLWYLKGRKVVTMGGSLVQAKIVYNYFTDYCEIHPSVADYIEGGVNGITMEETESTAGMTFSCVTASPKQIRGKHPDVLISDETCETSDELIDS
jgi:phage terminase large subunit-like protein